MERVTRLKSKLTRELQTTVSYLRYHFNQRDMFDKKMQAHHLYHHGIGIGLGGSDSEERKLTQIELPQQRQLKDYGKVKQDINEYKDMKKPTL